MKRKMKRVFSLLLLCTALMFSCDLIPEGWIPDLNNATALTAEEAKVEIRSANQDLTTHKEGMLQSKGFSALMYLSELMGVEEDYELKSAEFNATLFKKSMTYSNAFNYFRKKNSLKSIKVEEDDEMYGIFEYNFQEGTFELVSESTSLLQFTYPADDAAKYNQSNNAELKLTNLKYVEITSYEEVYDYSTDTYVQEPTTESLATNADARLTIDGREELISDYSASYSAEGMPITLNSKLESDDYTMTIVYKEKVLSYNAKISFEKAGESLIESDVNVTYNADKTAVKTYSGSSVVSPLKFEGTVNTEAIETYTEEYQNSGTEPDLTYLNSQVNVDVFQNEDNVKIGYLAYYMFYDAELGTTEPALAIVYEDGTYDWLDEVMTVMEL